MAEYRTAEGHSATAAARSISVPYIVLAAVLCGVGLFGMAFWLVTFNWLDFASLIPLVLGAVMLFGRGSGPDHA
jgi:hypothetical protein